MTALLAVPLVCAGAFLVAWSLASAIVVLLDVLGLVYSQTREERRSRDEVIPEPAPHPHRRPYVVDHDAELAAAIRAAVDVQQRDREPLRRRIEAARSRP